MKDLKIGLAAFASITAGLQAQTATRIDPLPDTGYGPLTISPDGRTIGATVWSSNRTSIRVIGDDHDTLLTSDVDLSGISSPRVTDSGRAFAQSWTTGGRLVGEWTSVGVIPLPGQSWALYGVGQNGDAVLADGQGGRPSLYLRNSIFEIPDVAGALRTYVSAMSGDARTIAGYARTSDDPLTVVPVRWNDFVTQVLPSGGWPRAMIQQLSADGRVGFGFVAQSPYESPAHLACWIEGSGPILIGEVGYVMAIARGGKFTVFSSSTGLKFWSPWAGSRQLSDFGFDATMNRINFSGMSEDGRRIVGLLNSNRDAYILDLPPHCELDYATDGFIDFFDYAAFVACFDGDCPNHRSADFNFDGFVDFFDYTDFVSAFEQGC